MTVDLAQPALAEMTGTRQRRRVPPLPISGSRCTAGNCGIVALHAATKPLR
jgi:hypothetical protein